MATIVNNPPPQNADNSGLGVIIGVIVVIGVIVLFFALGGAGTGSSGTTGNQAPTYNNTTNNYGPTPTPAASSAGGLQSQTNVNVGLPTPASTP